jgi:FtsZ-binding cell division protein ZapB
MRSLSIYFILIFLVGVTSNVQSQEQEGPQSLNEQFGQMVEDSESYQDYKVIKRTRLNSFWGIVTDSIQGLENHIRDNKQTIQLQKKEVDELKNKVSALEKQLQESEDLNNNIVFAGMAMKKSHYNVMVWGVIILLVLVIAIGYGTFRMNARGIKQLNRDLEETDNEFNEYKRITKEKEVKLCRELQTERNTVEELRNRLSSK